MKAEKLPSLRSRMRGIRTVAKAGRWLRSRFVDGGLILLYHRVAVPERQLDRDPFCLCVDPKRFAEQMAALGELGVPVALSELTNPTAASKASSRPAIAVTFDDGYSDNLELAKPILERHRIPATFFVVSGCIGRSFWWDDLSQALYRPKTLPERLTLENDGLNLDWTLPNSDDSSRKALFSIVYRKLRTLDNPTRNRMLERISAWAGWDLGAPTDIKPLTEDQLERLSSGHLAEIGSHTVSHPCLATLEAEVRHAEITESKLQLERLLDKPVTSFSYPYGSRSDVGSRTSTMLREAGFERACINEVDLVSNASDPFYLPRYWVGNWSGGQFSARLRRWLPT